MDISCDIIRDLLPLYAEDMVSNDSRGLVEAHLEGCDPCKKELELLKQAQKLPVDVDTHGLERVSKEIRKRKILTVLCVIVTIFSLIWSGMVFAVSPIYLTAEQAIEGVELREDGALAIDFARGAMGTGGYNTVIGDHDDAFYVTSTRYDWWIGSQEDRKFSKMTKEEIENYIERLYSKEKLSQYEWDRFYGVHTRYCFSDVNGDLSIMYRPEFDDFTADDSNAPYTPAEHTYDLWYINPGLKAPVLLWQGDDGQLYRNDTGIYFLTLRYLVLFLGALLMTIACFLAAHHFSDQIARFSLHVLGTIAGSIAGALLVITGGDFLDAVGGRADQWSIHLPSVAVSLAITALLWQWLYWVNHPEKH